MTTPTTDTDRLAEIRGRLADLNAKIKLRAENAERGIVTPLGTAADRLHQYAPTDLEFLLAENARLQERLDTAEGQVLIEQGRAIGHSKAVDSLDAWRRNWKPLVDAHMKRCKGCDACDSEDGDHA